MMKRKSFFVVMASFVILILGASSCTHDVGVNEGGPSGEMSGFSLQLQTPKGAYLTRAIAIGDENSISSIEIYAFDGDNMVGTNYLSEGTDYTTTVSGTTTTVNFTEEWVSKVAGKDITFYAVVNEDCGNGTTVTALNSGTPPTAKAAFEALVSDALPVEDDMVEMGINADFLMTGQSEPVKIVGKASGKITAKRRVARFDIVNPMAAEGDGQLVITNVQAFNAPVEGNVFASGPALTPARADYDFISFNTGSGFNLPVWSSTVTDGKNGNYVAETNSLGEDTWRCASAFYMYPTQLSPEAGAESMNLYVEAEQNGVKQVYVPANDTEIRANYRYTLTLQPATLTFTIEVADFDEGGEVPVEVGRERSPMTFQRTGLQTVPSRSDENGNWCVVYGQNSGQLLITVVAGTEFGSEVIFEPLYGLDLPVFANQSMFTKTDVSATTRAADDRRVKESYTFYGPADNDNNNPFLVRIKQAQGEDERRIYFVSQHKTAEQIFPDGVGNAMLGSFGVHYSLFLDRMLAATIQSFRSSAGMEYLPNIEMLTVNSIAQDATSIDITRNPNLKRVSFTIPNGSVLDDLTSIKIASSVPGSTESILTNTLTINGCPNPQTSLDISEWPGLESMILRSTQFRTIDIRNNHYLGKIDIINSGTGVTSNLDAVLLEGEYVKDLISTFTINNTTLPSLDFSKAKMNIDVLSLSGNLNLTSVTFPNNENIRVNSISIHGCTSFSGRLDVAYLKPCNTQYVIVNPTQAPISEVVLDPRVTRLNGVPAASAKPLVIYIPDSLYDELEAAGNLTIQYFRANYGFAALSSCSFGKWSVIHPELAGK